MTKPVVIYHAKEGEKEFMFAVSRKGQGFHREFKRHSRFGRKWSPWAEMTMEEFVKCGYSEFRRLGNETKVILPCC